MIPTNPPRYDPHHRLMNDGKKEVSVSHYEQEQEAIGGGTKKAADKMMSMFPTSTFLESLHTKLQQLCACSYSLDSHPTSVEDSYSEYFQHLLDPSTPTMDASNCSWNGHAFAMDESYRKYLRSHYHSSRGLFPAGPINEESSRTALGNGMRHVVRGATSSDGGVEECKEEQDDAGEDDCSRVPPSFYPRATGPTASHHVGASISRVAVPSISMQDDSLLTRNQFYLVHDESTRICNEFYKKSLPPSPPHWFASTALLDMDSSLMTVASIARKNDVIMPTPKKLESCFAPKEKIQMDDVPAQQLLKPRLQDFDVNSYYSLDRRVEAIAIDEDDMETTITTKKHYAQQQESLPAFYFTNIECYTARLQLESSLPITTADTMTTVSLGHSVESVLEDSEPTHDDGEDEDVIVVDRSSIPSEHLSHCFRSQYWETPQRAVPECPTSPPPPPVPVGHQHPSSYLSRMMPQNYIHGDDMDDDALFVTLALKKQEHRRSATCDPTNPPPLMPDLY